MPQRSSWSDYASGELRAYLLPRVAQAHHEDHRIDVRSGGCCEGQPPCSISHPASPWISFTYKAEKRSNVINSVSILSKFWPNFFSLRISLGFVGEIHWALACGFWWSWKRCAFLCLMSSDSWLVTFFETLVWFPIGIVWLLGQVSLQLPLDFTVSTITAVYCFGYLCS